MAEETSIDVEGWLVIEPTWQETGTNRVTAAKFIKVTTRPPNLTDDQRSVRIRLRVPRSVWDPLARISIDVPEAAVVYPDVTVG